MEFSWDKLKRDDKFMREGASWKRMLPHQPPTREVYHLNREEGEYLRDSHVCSKHSPTEEGRRIGDIWDDIRLYEEQANCMRIRTFMRSPGAVKRNRITIETSIDVMPVNDEEDYEIHRASLLETEG